MFVELIGLSGSGKSTVASLLDSRASNKITYVAPCRRRLPDWLLRHPVRTVRFLSLLAPHSAYALFRSDGPTGLSTRYGPTASMLNLLFAYERHRADASHEPIGLFDEFVLQRALSLFGFASVMPPWLQVSRYLQHVHRRFPAMSVFIEVEAGQALAQARSRPDGLAERYASLNAATVEQIYAVQANLMQRLVANLPAAVCVDGSQPPDAVAAAIENEVLRRHAEVLSG